MALILMRRAARMAALAATAFVFVAPKPLMAAPLKTPDAREEVVAGEFLVELREDLVAEAKTLSLESLSSRLGVLVVDRVRDDVLLVRVAGAVSPASSHTLEMRLRESQLLTTVEPNYLYYVSKTPNDSNFGDTWGLKNTGARDTDGQRGVAGVDIGAEAAWDITTGSKSVVVAVIDTGIDLTHPDLKSQAWVNIKEFNGKKGVDDDANGFIDDIHGYNFVDNNGDARDDHSHGTHCAGTIGAKGNDGNGVAGVNWNVSLMAVKFMNKKGAGSSAGSIKAIDYARKMGAKVLSNSWGGGGESKLLKKAIVDADKAGALFVVAAGNDSNDNDKKPSFPSNYDVPNVISVAAVDNRGVLADFSNYGTKTVHVAAPGVNIYSTVPGGNYEFFSGTSMAAPHVAGIAALMLAKNKALTNHQLRSKIISSARPLYSLKKRISTGAIVNAYSALTGAAPLADPNDPTLLKTVTPMKFSTDHDYKPDAMLEQKITIPGASKMAVRFSRFETEVAYDAVSFFDATGKFLGMLSGKQENGVTSPLIEGDTVVMKFVSDEANNAYGFDVDAVLSE